MLYNSKVKNYFNFESLDKVNRLFKQLTSADLY